MKKKIVGILVCTLLITTTVLPVTGNIKTQSLKEKLIGKNSSKESDILSLNEHPKIEVRNNKLRDPLNKANLDWIVKAQQTSDNNYILIGITETYGAGSRDGWLIKTDSNGDELWNKTWGGPNCDGVQSGQETSDGGYIIGGWGRIGPYWDTNFWLIKTNKDGIEQWNKRYGGAGYDDTGYFVQQTSDNGYIFTGFSTSYGAGSLDVWLVKTDSNGNEQWNNTFGGANSDGGFVVREVDEDDGYIITGWTDSFGSGSHEIYLIKTDSEGNEEWNKTFGGADSDVGHDVQPTSDGGYIIIGYTSSYGDYDRDFWLIKTDENGDVQWSKLFEGADAYTYIEVLGHSSGMSVREITNGYIIVGITDASFGNGPLSVFMIETDNYGDENWNKTFGGSSYDEGYWIDETSDGGYIISAGTMSYGSSTVDGWVIKTDSSGIKQWDKVFPEDKPPNAPHDPEPGDGETDVDIVVELNWKCSDPEGDPLKYDVYFGTTSPPPKVVSNQTGKTYDPGILDFETEYYWRIVAWDSPGGKSTSGPIWSFTTEENLPPYEPTNPDPQDGATDVSIDKDLGWTGEDPNEGDEVTYNVYFGKSSPPPLVAEGISDNSYDPGTMDLFTIYYWQIVTEDSQGESTSGPIWSFTTEEEPNEPPTAPEIDGPTEGPANTELCWTFHSDDPNENQVKYFIDWGDENTDETALSEPCTPIEKCHSYEAKGEYTITAYAQDEKGLNGNENTFKVTIPRTRTAYYSLIKQLFERFPSFLPLLRKLLFKK